MKVLLFWAYYPSYTNQFYQLHPALEQQSYQEQQAKLLADYFGWPPALVMRLAEQGCEVELIITNVESLQRAWAKENNVEFREDDWQESIAFEQVKRSQPDILWMGSMFNYFGEYLQKLRPYCKKILAWIACPSPSNLDLTNIDCVLTSHSNFKDSFERQGQRCERLLPAFEPRILEALPVNQTAEIDCSFVGNLSWAHVQRIHTMKVLAGKTPIQIWGDRPRLRSRGVLKKGFLPAYLDARSIQSRLNPSVWGMDMFEVLSRSAMTVNVHGEVAEGIAGNMRMFEATGVGALLLTEDAPNIKELYEPDEEVVTYKNTENLIDIIGYYVNHDKERAEIAAAGQRKTLEQHSTIQRSVELKQLFSVLLSE